MLRILISCLFVFAASYTLLYAGFRLFAKTNIRKPRALVPWLAVLAAVANFLFLPRSSNDKTAVLTPTNQGYTILLTGKRMPDTNRILSWMLPVAHRDSIWMVLPRSSGLVTGKEVLAIKGNKIIFGKIDLKDASVVVELYYDNAVNQTTDPLDWNGTYTLERNPGPGQ